jgi:hypothetical protein
MALIESSFAAAISTQNPVDTTHVIQEQVPPAVAMHRGWGMVRGVIWLAIGCTCCGGALGLFALSRSSLISSRAEPRS